MRHVLFPTLLVLAACSNGGDASLTYDMSSSAGTTVSTGGDASGDTGQAGQAGQLTAGEWRDLEDWGFWLGVSADPQGPLFGLGLEWGLTAEEHVEVVVHNDNGKPLADATVDLIDGTGRLLWTARSDVRGEAHLFPDMEGAWTPPLTIDVSSGDSLMAALDVSQDGVTEVQIEGLAPPNALDLVFAVDTTGSMTDELSYLATELRDVIHRVETDNQGVDLRLGTVFYRDHSDQYLVESVGFTRNVDTVVDDLKGRTAAGGGDWPEAVDEALTTAVGQLKWSDQATSRILFLILDAPPHRQDAQVVAQRVREAAEQGIRIIPVAASGVDKDTETLLRRMDIATGATYTFLTDDSGIGNDHLEPTVGPFEVEYLNDLMVRLISESL